MYAKVTPKKIHLGPVGGRRGLEEGAGGGGWRGGGWRGGLEGVFVAGIGCGAYIHEECPQNHITDT